MPGVVDGCRTATRSPWAASAPASAQAGAERSYGSDEGGPAATTSTVRDVIPVGLAAKSEKGWGRSAAQAARPSRRPNERPERPAGALTPIPSSTVGATSSRLSGASPVPCGTPSPAPIMMPFIRWLPHP